MFSKYRRLLIFDTETNSLNPEPDGEILEFGAILLEKNKVSNKFDIRKDINVLVKNKFPILNSHIHHITEEMCDKEGISKEEFFSLLSDIFGDYDDILIIAYNTPFDMKFIKAFMKEMDSKYEVKNPTLDVLEIAKDRTGLRRGNKLCDMIIRYSIENVQNSHRALDDVEATLEVMRAMWREKPDLEKYVKEG